jgi:predicted heme/steroid binding protein
MEKSIMSMPTLTFEQFQEQVSSIWKNASEKGEFRDYTPEFQSRICYQWQAYSSFGSVTYDTNDQPLWMADAGRSTHGRGESLEEAFSNEARLYDESFYSRVG